MVNGHHSGSSRSTTPEVEVHAEDPPQQPPTPPQPRLDSRASSRLVGTVKWFNAKAGYGFITRSDNDEDVFVHFSGIARKNPWHTMKSLGDGEIVEFNIMATYVTGINGRPVRGNPYVSHIPIRRTDSYASGDQTSNRRLPRGIFFANSQIPVLRRNWRQL